MNTFAVVLLCVQACLVQTVFNQCIDNAGYGAFVVPAAAGPAFGCGGSSSALAGGLARAAPAALGYGAASAAAYGGVGEGNVAAAGELPIVGNTAVIGVVPILGAVGFGGNLPASGCVSINGQCSCGCGIYIDYV